MIPVFHSSKTEKFCLLRKNKAISGQKRDRTKSKSCVHRDHKFRLFSKVQDPAIEGKKAAFFWLSASELSTFYIYTTLDPRAAVLTDLGMPLPDSVAALDNGKDFALTVSAENANQFSDVEIIITYGTDELLTALQADPLLSEISAVKNGAVVLLDSSDDLAASSTPSILSIPYTIDRYLEVLNAVAEKAV